MKGNKNQVIVGLGELLWDMFPEGKKAGGAPINFVYHATSLGAEGYAISAVGKDHLGDEIIDLINEKGVKHIITKVDYPTGTVDVQLKQGIPTYTITKDVAWDHIPLTDQIIELARNTDAVCFGTLAQRDSISRDSIRKFLSMVPENSFRILDINLRAPFFSYECIKESMQLCNILKLNDDELEIVKEMFHIKSNDKNEACKWLMNTYDLEYLILTAGADYSMVFSQENMSFIETPSVDVQDTVGAGDSFTGAFITSLLNGDTMEMAHSKAVKRAALVCTVAGAWVDDL